MRQLIFVLAFALFLALAALGTQSAAAQCAISNGLQMPVMDSIRVTGDLTGFRETAISKWESSCSGSGYSYPDLSVVGPADMTIMVTFYDRKRDDNTPGDGCESTSVSSSNGVMVGASIDIWDARRDGSDCNASVSDLIAHGLGHAFGFTDSLNSACDGTMMGRPLPGQPMQMLYDHCTFLRGAWWTPQEVEDAEECSGLEGQSGQCDGMEGSPILLDLAGDGFRLAGVEDGVDFDIDGDGQGEVIAWTESENPDGFLFLDRNGNGTVDDGTELFGNHTPLLDGTTALNGYIPLAEFDSPLAGGNGDGFLDPADPIFDDLQIWTDLNHDGESQSAELIRLQDAEVLRLALDFQTSPRRDGHGNLFKYTSHAWVHWGGAIRMIHTTDVFFVVEE